MRKLFLLFFLLSSTSSLFAQCPQNIGFELNNLTGWRSYIDTINCNSAALSCIGASPSCYGNPGLATLDMQVCNSLGPNKQINNTNTSRHNTIKVVNSAGSSNNPGPNDPFSGLPMVCPASGNNYSLQLGNAERNAHAERVISQFLVTGVNSSLIYRYAAVMEDISFASHHVRKDRPRLDFAVYDIGTPLVTNPTPIKIPCASFIQWLPPLDTLSLFPQNYPGWFPGASNTVCSNWIPVAVNLSSYVGHIIQMVYTTADCAQTGHFGYAYIDIPNGCKPFTISTGFCPGQDTAFLNAPSGFSHYDWYNGSNVPMTFLGSGKNTYFSTVGLTGTIAIKCVVTPPAGIGCNDTLVDSLRALPPPQAGFTWNQNICAGSPVQFLDTSNTHVAGSNIIHWEWDYNGDGITDDTAQNPFHIFANTGAFTIRLIVKSDLSCISDTAFGQIVNVVLPAIHPNAGNDTSICQGSIVQLNGSTYPNYSYYWYTLDGVQAPANGLSSDTISNPIASPLVSTTYYYKITDTINKCFFIDSMKITINGVAPNVMIQASKDTICPLASSNLDVVNNLVSCGPTLVYCNGTPTSHVVGAGTSNVSTYPTPFSYASDAKMQMLILASELTAASINPGEIEGITFNVTAKNSTTPFRLFTVKMGCTTLGSYPTSSSFQTTSVVASYNSYSTSIGSNYIPLQSKFMWDGTSNLVVEICYSNVITSPADKVAQSTTPFNSVIYGTSFGGNPSGCAITSGSISANRPTIGFTTCTSSFAAATYSWTPAVAITGSTTIKNPVAHPLATTTYSCLINDGNGCTSTVTKTIVVDNTTSVNLGNDTTICNGQIYVPQPIVAGVAPYSYTWTSTPIGTNSNLATPSLSPSVTTTYTLSFHGYHNCAVSDNIVVHVNPIPTSSFTVNPNPVCSADTAIITYTGNAPASANYVWNFGTGGTIVSGSGQGPYKIKWSSTGTKSVTLTVINNNCSSSITTLQVLVNLSPIPSFTVNPAIICTGAANVATISYSGNAPSTSIYNWNFDGGTVVSGSGQGAYSVYWASSRTANVKLTITEAGCTATQIVPVVVNLTPTSNFSVSPIAACSGQNITINYTGNMPCPNGLSNPFSWNFGTPTVSPGGTSCGPHTLSYGSGGTYNITLNINNNGCLSTTTTVPVNITQTPTSAFSIFPNSICSGVSTTISYTGNGGATAGYNWNVSGVSNPVHISGSGPFNISWTDNGNAVVNETVTLSVAENGCTSNTSTLLVAVTPNPTADFMVTSPVCAGADATVTYIGVNNTSSANYVWNWGSGNPVSGSGQGPYTIIWPSSGTQFPSLTVSQNGCSSNLFTVPVNVLANPLVQAHPDTSICPHTMVSLWAEGANSYLWTYDNSTMPGLNVIPAASPTTYTVIGTDNSGCKGTGTVTVKWRLLPPVNAGNDTTINRGNTVHIGSMGNISYLKYLWSSNPSTYIAQDTNRTSHHLYYTTSSPINTTMFILGVEDTFGCKNADTVNVVVKGCTGLEVPNAFIPSGANEINRVFRAANTKALLSLTRFEIYNRWGVKIFSSNDRQAGWDGKYNGVEQEMGSYTYYIEGICEDGIPVHKEGNVTLIR